MERAKYLPDQTHNRSPSKKRRNVENELHPANTVRPEAYWIFCIKLTASDELLNLLLPPLPQTTTEHTPPHGYLRFHLHAFIGPSLDSASVWLGNDLVMLNLSAPPERLHMPIENRPVNLPSPKRSTFRKVDSGSLFSTQRTEFPCGKQKDR